MSLLKPQNNWTPVPNTWLKDTRLSAKGLGILCKLNSLPPNWEFSVRGLAAIMKDGRESIQSGIEEVESLGYLTRQDQPRTEDGRYRGGAWVLHETPTAEKPTAENQAAEKPAQYNNERTKELNTINAAVESTTPPSVSTPTMPIVRVDKMGYGTNGKWKRLRTVYTTEEQADIIEAASEADYLEFKYWPSPPLVGKEDKAKTMGGVKKTCLKIFYPEPEDEPEDTEPTNGKENVWA